MRKISGESIAHLTIVHCSYHSVTIIQRYEVFDSKKQLLHARHLAYFSCYEIDCYSRYIHISNRLIDNFDPSFTKSKLVRMYGRTYCISKHIFSKKNEIRVEIESRVKINKLDVSKLVWPT